MAKITIVGDAVVVTSSMKLEDLKTISKYRPEALILKGGEDGKEPVFGISVVPRGMGELSKYGASFGSESHDDSKFATITMHMNCGDVDDVKEAVADQLGATITNLTNLEKSLPDILSEIATEKAAVMNSISVAQ